MRIGVDLGGTKIEAIVLGDDGRVLFRQRQPTPQGDYRATLEAIAGLVERASRDTGCQGGVGLATPGALSPASGRLKNANSTCLNDQPLLQDLKTLLGRPVRIANDADCMALSEARDGAAAGEGTVFGVILGTGTGGGICVQGQLLSGPNAIAGEWGHNPLPWPRAWEWPGTACYCGKTGCIETFLSGPGLSHQHQQDWQETVSAQEIGGRAATGDLRCRISLSRYEDRLARALAGVINVLDPDVIVLAGGLSNLDRLYTRVPERWSAYVFSDRVDTRLLPARHGDSSGVRGAAWLWPIAKEM